MNRVIKNSLWFVVLLALFGIGVASANQYKKDKIIVDTPWIRASHTGSKAVAGYAHIINNSDQDEYLTAVSSPISKKVQLHEMKMENNVMVMRHLRKPILIKAHSSFTLKPGGYHIMFMKMPKPIVKGQKVPAVFFFRNVGSIKAELPVADSAASKAP